MKSFEDFQAYGKESFEAYMASVNAMTRGMQVIATETAEFSRKALEKGTEAFEKVAATKSFDKALEAQQVYAKDAFDTFSAQVNKVGELYAAAAKDAYRPFEAKFAQFGVKAPQ